MRIIVYQGGAQYNAFNRFAENLHKGFLALGHESEIINLVESAKKHHAPLMSALARKPNAIIAFNGIGAELMAGKTSIYEKFGVCYLELLLDHPAFHTSRIRHSPRNAILGVVEQTHIDYLKKTAHTLPSFFSPHGGIQHPNYESTDRPIDVLFLGTGLNPQKEQDEWKVFPIAYQDILHAAYEEFLKKPQAWDILIDQAARAYDIYMPTHLMAAMIVQLEIVMRADYRLKVLKALDDAGIKVTIMGNGWEYAKFKNHELYPSAEYYDAMALMCKSRVSMNASPQFFTGTHERVFMAMLNGSLAFTSRSTYYDAHFTDGQHYLGYDLPSLHEGIDKLKAILGSPAKLAEIRQQALTVAIREHTWESRAERILDNFSSLAMCCYLHQKQWP
jgi:hypothetical protein